jgi:hypothetical protein
MAIDQIYYTHCTFRTSALAPTASDQPYGYSPRASSMPADRLQACCRTVLEPILSRRYRLPDHVDESAAAQWTAADAPVRLFFDANGKSPVLGAIFYRAKDATGQRVGSYFAHFLVGEPLLACSPRVACRLLQLFSAPGWQRADDAGLPHHLATLHAVEQLLAGKRPAVDEEVVRSFIASPRPDGFDDPAGIVPPEYRRMPAERRRQILETLLHGLLSVAPGHGQSVLLRAEPGMAALLFFAVLRLLPTSLAAAYTSFSTFETELDVLPATLVATGSLGKPASAREANRAIGFCLDPSSGDHSALEPAHAAYGRWMLRLLIEEGWSAVDRCLERMGAAPRERLDHYAELEALAASWLAPLQAAHAAARGPNGKLPAAAADPRPLTSDDHCYLARAIADRLSTSAIGRAPEVAALGQLPAGQLGGLFHALAQAEPLYGFASRIAVHLDDEPALRLWTDTARPEAFRQELLNGFLTHAEAFTPPMVEALEQAPATDESFWAMLSSVLVGLAPAKAACVVDSLSPACQQKLMAPLLDQCRLHPIGRRFVQQMVDGWPMPVLIATLAIHGAALAKQYPGQRLSNLASGMLGKLAEPAAADRFSIGLDVLGQLTSLVDKREAAAIENWLDVRNKLQRLSGAPRGPIAAWLLGSVSASETAAWLKSLSQACYQSGSKTDWKHRQRLAVALWQAASGREMPADILETIEQQLFWPVWQAQLAAAEFDCHERPRLTLPHDAREAPLLVFSFPAGQPRWLRMEVECRPAENAAWKRGGARSFLVPSDSSRELQISLSDLKFLAVDGQSLELRCLFSASSWPADAASAAFRPAERQPLRINHCYKITLAAGNVSASNVSASDAPRQQHSGNTTRGPVSP